MDRARSRRPWKRNQAYFGRRASGAALVLVTILASVVWSSSARAGEVAVVPSSEGRLGAWLALRPIAATAKGNRAPRNMETNALAGADEQALVGRLGKTVSISAPEGDPEAPTTASWRVVSSGSGPIDIAASLNLKG